MADKTLYIEGSDGGFYPQTLKDKGDGTYALEIVTGGLDGSSNFQADVATGTGGKQVTPDGLDILDDNAAVSPSGIYPAQSTVTFAGGETTAVFTFSLATAGPALLALRSVKLNVENTSGQTINAGTIAFTDTVGTTTLIGPTYQLFNTPTAGAVPTLSVATASVGQMRVPFFRRGVMKNVTITFTLAAGATAAGTCKLQVEWLPHELPLDFSHIIYANLVAQGTVTNTSLIAAPGANAGLYLLEATVTNEHATVAARVSLLSGSGGTVLAVGYAAAVGGRWALTWAGPYGRPLDALNRGLFLTTNAAGSVDVAVACSVY